MTPILLSIATFLSTFAGGIVGIRHKKHIPKLLGFTAGIILGVIAFDILPELFNIIHEQNLDPTPAMIALTVGFLLFHISEKYLLIHHAHENEYGQHRHPSVGILSALALSGHSFLDGVGIGLGFQVSPTVGIAVAIAVIGHDFADGLNTVSLMLNHKNSIRRTLKFLLVDALAPVLGVASTFLFTLSDSGLVLYLGFFAGFLLYIGASDILPQAHEHKSSKVTLLLTVLGTLLMFVITRYA
ncbi:MAG: ZIP family metal transporter [Candidatus Nomurabacteria bacterium]|nr:MAG: ZIP family metal transporter [Candidatus Nomurabacteria bacterium]